MHDGDLPSLAAAAAVLVPRRPIVLVRADDKVIVRVSSPFAAPLARTTAWAHASLESASLGGGGVAPLA
jgi:hypothetical protein